MAHTTNNYSKLSEHTSLHSSQSIASYNSTASPISSLSDNIPQFGGLEQYEMLETSAEFRSRMISLTVAYCVLFLIVIQSSMYWTSLWPFLHTIDPSVDESFFGWILMAYNLSGALASPLFGYWTNRLHGSKIPIMFGLALNIVGNLILAFVESFPVASRKWIMVTSRLISGLGAGNRGALFAYTVMSSKENERNRVISIRGAITSGAIMLGPGIQAATVPIGYPGFVKEELRINMYTTPAYLIIVLGISLLLIMSFVFTENWISVSEQQNDEYVESTVHPYDVLVLLICGFARFTLDFCFTIDDTIGSPLTMIMFNWTKSQAILYNGMMNVVIGFIDIFAQIIVGNFLLKWVSERKLIIFGLSMMLCFFVVVFPWPGLPLILDSKFNSSLTQIFNGNMNTAAFLQNSTIVPMNTTNKSDMACDYAWCSTTTRINLVQYLIAFGFLLISISTGYTPAATLFSKALGPHQQGTWQGFFSACDHMGMTLSPPIASNLFQFAGPRVMWGVAIGLTVITIIPFIAYFERLVPWREVEKRDGVSNVET